MKKYVKCVFLVLVLVIGFISFNCVGVVESRKMDLNTDIRSQQILNLRYYGGNDIDFIRQAERLMKNGFLDTRGEEYGYYRIAYNTDAEYGWGVFSIIHACFLTLLYPLSLVGFPTDDASFDLTAYLYIYDSEGNLVKSYQKRDSFTQIAGIYYGAGDAAVTRKAARVYSKLFEDLFRTANVQSGEINQALLKAGPVTQGKDSAAKSKIASYSTSSYVPSYSYSDDSSSEDYSSSGSSTTDVGKAIADAFKSPLQSGTYSLSGTQAKIRLTSIAKSGVLSYTNRQGGTGTGTYSIDGNRMTIQMEGYTFVYIVTSETSFRGDDGTWVRTGF
jgi:hypothetical protein